MQVQRPATASASIVVLACSPEDEARYLEDEAHDDEDDDATACHCCSARSGTAMDLGLDYFRVLLALGLFQVRFCTPKSAWPVGVIGVSRQAFSEHLEQVMGYRICNSIMP